MADDSFYEEYGNKEAEIKQRAKEWRKQQYQKQKERIAQARKKEREDQRQAARKADIDSKENGSVDLEKLEFLKHHLIKASKLKKSPDSDET